MRFSGLIIITLLLLTGCNSESDYGEYLNLDELPYVQPEKFFETDHVDDIFFDHLNYSSIALSNGNVILNDRPQGLIFSINGSGELVDLIAIKGRGPGEIQDASALNTDPDENLVIFDQMNQKIVFYPSDGSNPEEFLPFEPDLYRVRSAHALNSENSFLIVGWMPSALSDPDKSFTNKFTIYDRNADTVINDRIYPDREYARQIIDGRVRGGVPIPFAPDFHFSFSSDRKSIFISWSETNEIAELNSTLDTLRTISVPLKREILTRTEIDSIEQSYRNRRPNPWDVLSDVLPEFKVSFDGLIVDHLDQIWLKLTRKSEWQEWLILSNDGDPEKLVRLPKEGILTHVSEHHLGFRADDHLFALYEPVD